MINTIVAEKANYITVMKHDLFVMEGDLRLGCRYLRVYITKN